MARHGSRDILRRKKGHHRRYRFLLSRLQRERPRPAAAKGMRAALASGTVFDLAGIPAHPPHRYLCVETLSGRATEGEHDRNRQGLARVHTTLYSPAASFVAQQCVAQEQSMVRRRVAPLFAKACAACAVALIAACAPTIAPRGTESVPPTIANDAFVTRDGLKLPFRHWDAKDPKAIIVALHGMSDYSNAFAIPAPYLAEHGISVVAYDQRSFGRAPNPGIWPGGDALRGDLHDIVDVVRARHPNIPIIVLGESMGGAVVLSALASDRKPNVDGVILVAPAVWSRQDMPLLYRVAL